MGRHGSIWEKFRNSVPKRMRWRGTGGGETCGQKQGNLAACWLKEEGDDKGSGIILWLEGWSLCHPLGACSGLRWREVGLLLFWSLSSAWATRLSTEKETVWRDPWVAQRSRPLHFLYSSRGKEQDWTLPLHSGLFPTVMLEFAWCNCFTFTTQRSPWPEITRPLAYKSVSLALLCSTWETHSSRFLCRCFFQSPLKAFLLCSHCPMAVHFFSGALASV